MISNLGHVLRRYGLPLLALISLVYASPSSMGQTELYAVKGQSEHGQFGSSMARVGDMDGDGISEFAVGAPSVDDTGEVTVHRGVDGAVLWTWSSSDLGDQAGFDVTGLGDVSGDGVPDIAITAPFADGSEEDLGSVIVLSGSDGSALYALLGDNAGDEFGTSVARLGDMDGDGISEFAVGSPGFGGSGNDSGMVSVHSGWSGALLLTVEGDSPGDRFGNSLGRSDFDTHLDADGIPDFVVGAEQPNGCGYIQALSGQSGVPLYTATGIAVGDAFGRAISIGVDRDGDGIRDLWVGSPGDDQRDVDAGAVFSLSGQTGDVIQSALGRIAHDGLGSSLASIDDLSGDGLGDILVGAPGSNRGRQQDCGTIEVRSGLDGSLIRLLWGDSGSRAGSALAPLGDLTGDGISEFLIASPGAECIGAYGLEAFSPGKIGGSDSNKTPPSPWKHSWGNNGSGWIGGWHVGLQSRFLAGRFIPNEPKQQLLALGPKFGPGDYAKLLVYSSGSWPNPWGNNGNGTIGFWSMTDTDVYVAGNFDSSTSHDELLCLNPIGAGSCAKVQGYDSVNNQWWSLWSNSCDGTIGGSWNLGPGQQYIVGNFDGTPGDELLCIGGVYAKLFQYDDNTSSWIQLWGNNGDGMIFNGLLMDSVDQYIAGDFDPTNGVGLEELMVITEAYGTYGYSLSKSWNGNSTGNLAWTGDGAGSLSGLWTVDTNDTYVVGNLVPGGGDDLMAISPSGSLSHLFSSDGTTFQLDWTSVSGTPWNLAYYSTYVAGDFVPGNGTSELLNIKLGGLYSKMWHFDP